MNQDTSVKVLGVDFGKKRIGIALASLNAKLPVPFLTIENNKDTINRLKEIISEENVTELVVGIPKSLDNKTTEQTTYTLEFIELLKQNLNLPIFTIDEAATSIKAESELNTKKRQYNKSDIDSLAAVYILEDWLKLNPQYGKNI